MVIAQGINHIIYEYLQIGQLFALVSILKNIVSSNQKEYKVTKGYRGG